MTTDPPKGMRQLMHIIALNPNHDYLLGKGFRKVGSGHFSTVYSHPTAPGYVFKVNQDYNRYEVEHELPSRDGYGPFADFVMARFEAQGHCRYLPRILSKVQSTAGRTVWCIERLTPGDDCSSDHDLALSVSNRVLNAHSFRNIEEQRRLIEDAYPELLELLRELRQLGLDMGARPDIHGSNYMIRDDDGKEDFVITDPFSFIRHERVKTPVTRFSKVQELRNRLAWAELEAERLKRRMEAQEVDRFMARDNAQLLFMGQLWNNPVAAAPVVRRVHKFPAFVQPKPRRWAAG